ncbi:MAG: glucosylglycerol-phosphate synthase [Pseudomonadota bacterium]|nr:glucosylglycerol-phosphate synthase [Pseudomonadota bacterium]
MLLATDLDGTFLAGDTEERHQLYQLIARHPDIQLVFVTGRGLETVLPLLSDPSIPQPDYIICDVGATVCDGHTRQAVQPLQSQIEGRWPGEQAVAAAMERFPELERQATPQERRCSYFCRAGDVTEEVHRVAAELDCEVLFSANTYLDILPKGVNKGSTLKAFIDSQKIDTEQVLVAGDTVNDLSMFSFGFKGVCVGNAEAALLEQTKGLARVLHAHRSGCGGILEALAHFGFLGPQGVAALGTPDYKPGKSDMVIVYHRLPYEETVVKGTVKRQRHQSPNGILPTLLSFFEKDTKGDAQRGAWIAWSVKDPKIKNFETHTTVDVDRYPNLIASRVALTKSDVDIFYKSFSKEAFWPLLHTFWERARFREDHWQVYLKVNQKFAEAAAAEAAENAIIWIHDYNLWMVPAFLREMRPDVRIAFFHHTYFPSADIFNVVPWRRAIIGSLLQCDYVGFHIPRQVENFVDVARGVMPIRVLERQSCAPRFLTYGCAMGLDEVTSVIESNGRRVHIGANPVGVNIERINEILQSDKAQAQMAELRTQLKGLRLILSVERLDYTKGILEKMQAYERLLAENPELHRKITLISICVPAAREMTIYRSLQTQIEQVVGRINGRFAQVGWQPVQFFFRSFPFEEVVAYYAMADVMWITPLRDGLNLVAKEFAAAQGITSGRGVLVLSEFAGAAAELKGALLTNPHDHNDLVSSIYLGITMGRAESEDRLRTMYDIVRYNDIRHWSREFLEAVEQASTKPSSAAQSNEAA